MADTTSVIPTIDAGITTIKDTVQHTKASDYTWILELGVDLIYTLGGTFVFLGIIYLIYKGKDVKKMAVTNPMKTASNLATLSCLVEVLTLTLAAVARGNPFSTSFGGYLLIALVEIFMVFITMDNLGKVIADGEIRFTDKKDKKSGNILIKHERGILFSSFVWVICTFIVTTCIFQLYKEAIGAVSIFSDPRASYFNVIAITSSVNNAVQLELRSIIIIYSTEFFMFIGIIFEYRDRKSGRNPSIVRDTHKSNIQDTINARGELENSNRNNRINHPATREEELKQLIKNSIGLKKDRFINELDNLNKVSGN